MEMRKLGYDPALSVDGLALALNCSRRQLYNAFAEESDGVAGYILNQRLLACRTTFDDRRHGHRSITDIALGFGFQNMAHFSRDIRKDLGVKNLPFVIAAMGQNGSKPASGAMLIIRDALLGATTVKTPDPLFDAMVNRWLLYQTVACRLPFVLGPENYEDRESFAFSRLLAGAPILLTNGGNAIHSFVYAGDVAQALIALLQADDKVDRQAFNIAIGNMAAVFAQVSRDAISSRFSGHQRGAHGIGMVTATRIADGGDVVDVDPKA